MSGTAGFVDPTHPNLADYTLFLRNYVGIGAAYLPDNSFWITGTLRVGETMVILELAAFDGFIYTLAVYNYATDRLINFAIDQPGASFFADRRQALGLNNFSPGLITSSSDQGTSQSMEVPDWAKNMTMGDLALTKTPYGRAYLAIAQNYGTIWGLT
jgi:hypothetical protein